MVETVEHLIVGAGPAGLRAAQVLAEAGREVLVLEKKESIGPKTCAGGLTRKSVRELEPLGLTRQHGLESTGYVSFDGEAPKTLDADAAVVRTIARRQLGLLQAEWTRRAGAEIRIGTPAAVPDLERRVLVAGGQTLRYSHLVGADGADSAIRRALHLPHQRRYFAGEFNVPGLHLEPLRIECDSADLANGYFWVFPHLEYSSIGAVAPKRVVPPAAVRRYLEARCDALGVDWRQVPFEGATLEVECAGFDFAGGVHLVGDAAGVPSALTAEGIYAALITAEETARRILDPGFPSPKTRRWLTVKRRHDALAHALRSRLVRGPTLATLARVSRCRPAARRMATWFLAG
jgi:flavin-dependent dehydrogenase